MRAGDDEGETKREKKRGEGERGKTFTEESRKKLLFWWWAMEEGREGKGREGSGRCGDDGVEEKGRKGRRSLRCNE